VNARWGGKATVAHVDGHVKAFSLEDLRVNYQPGNNVTRNL
jgi:prepilin-type processing-associated H-X9-DG protein